MFSQERKWCICVYYLVCMPCIYCIIIICMLVCCICVNVYVVVCMYECCCVCVLASLKAACSLAFALSMFIVHAIQN